jgi:hypothetical protein
VKHTFLVLCWITLSLAAVAAESENVLQVFADELRRKTSQEPPPIALTAKLTSRNGKHFLAFRLTNISQRPLQFYPSMLPWGNPSSLSFAGVATNGARLRNIYPIADPPPEDRITIAPGESREGEYPLSWGFAYHEAPAGAEVLLMWAYRVLVDFDRPFPVCSGVVAIPKRQ